MNKANECYRSSYGTWKVTTEGDCEGRTIKDLGTYDGHVDEIAFALADRSFYSLCFKPVKTLELDVTPKKDEVNIHFDIDSGTWNLIGNSRVKFYQEFFKRDDRDVRVEKCNYYACVTLKRKKELNIKEQVEDALKKAGFDPEEVKRYLSK